MPLLQQCCITILGHSHKCNHICENQIVKKVLGVSAVRIDFEHKTATVSYDSDKIQPEALTELAPTRVIPQNVKMRQP
jgi:hypothetical protein